MVGQFKRSWSVIFLSLLVPGLGHYRLGLIKQAWIFFGLNMVCRLLFSIAYFDVGYSWHVVWVLFLHILFLLVYTVFAAWWSSSEIDPQMKTAWPKVFGVCAVYVCLWLGALVVNTVFFMQAFEQSIQSMAPTLIKGDRILAEKWRYRSSDPRRGDVIVFKSPKDRKQFLIQRIVGLSQEKIEIKEGRVYVNGQLLSEPLIFDQLRYLNKGDFGKAGQVVEVPAGHYYVLGDNRKSNYDSRKWGFVAKADIIGRAHVIYEPGNRRRLIE